MRDPKRIKTFCNQLAEHWSKVPDWRFGQFIANVLGEELNGRDIFFPEDDEMMGYFDHFFSNYTSPSRIVNNHIDFEK